MGIIRRIGYATAIVVIDFTVFFIPLAAIVLAYVIVARPSWFRELVDDVYGGRRSSPPA